MFRGSCIQALAYQRPQCEEVKSLGQDEAGETGRENETGRI